MWLVQKCWRMRRSTDTNTEFPLDTLWVSSRVVVVQSPNGPLAHRLGRWDAFGASALSAEVGAAGAVVRGALCHQQWQLTSCDHMVVWRLRTSVWRILGVSLAYPHWGRMIGGACDASSDIAPCFVVGWRSAPSLTVTQLPCVHREVLQRCGTSCVAWWRRSWRCSRS